MSYYKCYIQYEKEVVALGHIALVKVAVLEEKRSNRVLHAQKAIEALAYNG